MGCDIHLYVERYNEYDEQWEYIYQEEKYRDEPSYENSIDTKNYYGYKGRNYNLFSILAGVRNGIGIEPISKPRGVPDDISPEVSGCLKRIASDGHSYSYFTLKELLDFDWNRVYDDGTNWEDNAIQRVKKRLKLEPDDVITYKDLAGDFYDVTLMRLTLLDENPKNVRIVFWFDT